MRVHKRARNWKWAILALLLVAVTGGCSRSPRPSTPAAPASAIQITVNKGGPVVITSTAAEFQVLPSGYIQASLIKDGKKLTLDDAEPGKTHVSNSATSAANSTSFGWDFSAAKISYATGKMGRGRQVQ